MNPSTLHGDAPGGSSDDLRLDRLESRLLRIERHLGLGVSPLRLRRPITAIPPVRAATPAPSAPRSATPTERFADLLRRRESARARVEPASASAPSSGQAPQWDVLPDQPPLAYEAKSQPQSAAQNAWEQIIGLKLAGWVGAIVLVIGLGLGIKYAYDQHWLGYVPPPLRLALMYVAGFGLIGAGEVVYRRINKISAAGFFGAGIAALFLVSYAGHGYYRLYQRETAFTLMALSTLIGAAVAMRGRLVSIAALALIGGLLAPLVLESDSHPLGPFLAFLLMLQVVALVLSWWGGSARWWMLRGLSLAGTTLWMGTILLPHSPPAYGPALPFMILYSVLYQLEVILSTLHRKLDSDEIESSAGVLFSVIVTALLTIGLLWLFHTAPDPVRGLIVVALSAANLALDLTLRRRAPALAQAYRIQSIILLLIAVPIAFSGAAVTIGWVGVALALAAIDATRGDRLSRGAAVGAWALAVVNLFSWIVTPETAPAANRAWLTILAQPIAAWTIIGWGLVACGHAIAVLMGVRRTEDDSATTSLSAIASALLVAVTIAALPPVGASGVLIGYAWLLVASEFFWRANPSRDPLALLPQALIVLAIAASKWIVIDTLAARFAPGWAPAQYRPIINPLFLTGVALAGSIVGIYQLRRQRLKLLDPILLLLSAMVVMLWAGSFEIDRVVAAGYLPGVMIWPDWQIRHFAWTACWTIGIVAFLWAVHLQDGTALRRLGVLHALAWVPVVLAAKYLLLDTLVFRPWRGAPVSAVVIANLQNFAGAFVFAGLLLIRHLFEDDPTAAKLRRAAGAAAMIMLLWLGSLEIDRAFLCWPPIASAFADPRLAEQVGLSIFWSAFAIACVAAGFRIRLAGLRYFGLALFALTLAKVALIDLRHAETGYRILSFFGLGGLLLGTSVLYGKLSSTVLANDG